MSRALRLVPSKSKSRPISSMMDEYDITGSSIGHSKHVEHEPAQYQPQPQDEAPYVCSCGWQGENLECIRYHTGDLEWICGNPNEPHPQYGTDGINYGWRKADYMKPNSTPVPQRCFGRIKR